MSISRSILSRPQRPQEAPPRRGRGRLALIATIVLAVSACTAVAADGLPSGDDDRSPSRVDTVDTTIPRAPVTIDPGDGANQADVVLPVATTAVPATAAEQPTAPAAPIEVSGDEATVVAHAVSANVVARQRPAPAAEPVAEFANPTDRGGPLVFQGIGEPVDGWLEVLLPIRPNGTTGWVELDDVTLTRNPYRIEVDLGTYELVVRRDGEVEISAPVAIGQGGTPTPIGDFYLIELLQPPQPNGPYGSYAYGLSGYSDVLDNFNGGDGVIGIHGTNQPGLLGGPASHGCIRIHNDTIELMAEFLPLGTPVSIIEASR